jgi:hypothetical protein
MTQAEEFERGKRLIRVQRKFIAALHQASQKFVLNVDIGTIEARDAGNALDEAMFNFVEGTATMEDVETAFKAYIKTIIEDVATWLE